MTCPGNRDSKNFSRLETHIQLKDKAVLITGAAGEIGKAATKAFHDQGANLVLVDLNKDALEAMSAELGLEPDRSVVIAADVSKETEVQNFVASTKARFGKIDVFFNNAGAEGKTGPCYKLPLHNNYISNRKSF